MSSNLRKCISLGVAGFEDPGGNYSYKTANNQFWFNDTNTRWIRLWVDWSKLAPTPDRADPANYVPHLVSGMDEQIQLARRSGRSVILALMHKFPTWVDGQPSPYKVPNDRSTNGAWANFIRWLYNRYKPYDPTVADASIQMLEVVNEPNLKFEPRDAALAGKVVDMLRTAQAISAGFDHQIHLGGPALSDKMTATTNDENVLDYIPYTTFMDQMRATGFRASHNFVWTHHNYGDVERGSGSSRTARDHLQSWWTGYDEGDGPVVFCTEGGARLAIVGDTNNQNTKVTGKFNDLKTAARVGMQTNYLTCDSAEANYSGILGPPPAFHQRVVYGGWKGLTAGRSDVANWRVGQELGPWTQWDPAILSRSPGHLEVFAIGGDNACWHKWSGNGGGSWSNWESLGGGCTSAPGVVSLRHDLMDMFVLGQNGQLWQKWYTAAGGWGDWHLRDGWCTYDPAPASWNDQHLDVFVRWGDGTLWHRWWFASSGWSNWERLFGGQVVGSPSAVSWGDGRIDVVFRGTDNRIHHMFYSNGWNGPSPLPGGGGATGSPEIVSWKPGHLDVICPGSGGKLYRLTYDRLWGDWEPIPHTFGHHWSPGAVSWGGGCRIDVAIQRNNVIRHLWFE